MSLMLATGVLKYRETENDPWQPLVLRASMDLNALADEFDSTKSYTRGDYVLKDNELYICKATAIQENTPWASSRWRKTSLAHELIRTQTVYYAEAVSYSGSTECLVTADIINPSNRSIDPMEMNSNGTLLVLNLGTIPSGSTGIFNLSLNITGLSSSWYVYKADGTTYNINELNSNSTLLLVFQSNFTYDSNDTVTAKDVGWHMIGDLSASDKVSKSGDTMTGDLTISHNDSAIYMQDPLYGYGDLPSSAQSQWLIFKEKSGVPIGTVKSNFMADGSANVHIRARARVNNANVDNGLVIQVNADGTRSIGVTDPAAWRSALALGEIINSTNNGATIAVPNDTSVICSSITLTQGVWVLVVNVDWDTNASGYRQVAVGSSALNPGRDGAVTSYGLAGKQVYLNHVSIKNVTSGSQTFNIYARQNSGSSLSCYPYAYAVRVG